MRVELEWKLWSRTLTMSEGASFTPRRPGPVRQRARDIIREMVLAGEIQHPKQAWRTLEKWCDRGLYEFGTTLDLGWRLDDAVFPRLAELTAAGAYPGGHQKDPPVDEAVRWLEGPTSEG